MAERAIRRCPTVVEAPFDQARLIVLLIYLEVAVLSTPHIYFVKREDSARRHRAKKVT